MVTLLSNNRLNLIFSNPLELPLPRSRPCLSNGRVDGSLCEDEPRKIIIDLIRLCCGTSRELPDDVGTYYMICINLLCLMWGEEVHFRCSGTRILPKSVYIPTLKGSGLGAEGSRMVHL